MGTSKSYLQKVTKNTTRTKINITNAIKNGTENQIEGIKKVVSSFKISQENDLFGVKNNNYVQALSTIGQVISSISSLGIGMFADQFRDKYNVEQIKTPRECHSGATMTKNPGLNVISICLIISKGLPLDFHSIFVLFIAKNYI